MPHTELNTICPVCGLTVPETMPPMELVHTSHLDDRGVPMLRVCCVECARVVNQHPELYYRAAKANVRAYHETQD